MVQKKAHKSKPKSQKAHPKPKDGKEIEAQLGALGLRIVHITADGNCLFRAVADQLEGNEEEHSKYRRMVVDHIESHREEFEPFLEDDVPFEDYCKNMKQSSTWAGHMELQVISLVTHTNICIHKLSSPRWHIQNFESTKGHCIHLSYQNGEHYNSVRRKDDCGGGPAKAILLEMPAMEEPKDAKEKAAKKKNSSHRLAQKKSQPLFVEKERNEEKMFCNLEDNDDKTGSHCDENGLQRDFAEPSMLESRDGGGTHAENGDEIFSRIPFQQIERVARNKACPCGSKKKYKACCGTMAPSARSQEIAASSTKNLSNKARKQKLRNNKGMMVQPRSEGAAAAAKELPDMGFLCI